MSERKSGQRTDARSLALETLLEIGRSEKPGHLVIRSALSKNRKMDQKERRLYRKLVEGCLEQQILLDYVINQYAKTKTTRMKPVIRTILRMGVYQICMLSAVPDSAAVNEAVKLAVRRGFGSLRGFVNGVLRTVAREKDRIPWPVRETDPEEYISIMYSVPKQLVLQWTSWFGTEKTEQICRSFQEQAPLTVRLRPGMESDAVQLLEADGVQCCSAPYVPFARCLTGAEDLESLEAFRRGMIAVQDVSSMLAVLTAGIREGDTVLDLCAAPGGKSLLAADLLKGTGQVTARDLTEQKAALIRDNCSRLGVKNVEVQVRDASVYDEEMYQKADVVLADLPCSGLGVIGRKPDIRYHASDEKTESLVLLQRRILENAVRYVKPGGTLLYSTCTFDPRENDENAAWLAGQTNCRPDPAAPYLPEELAAEAGSGNTLQLLPGIHRCDGFFIARFKVEIRCRI